MENFLMIRNKKGLIVPFKSNPVQEIYWRKKTRRNIWLKPRQEGLSKVIDGDQLIDCVRKHTNAVVISHEKEATKRLFAAVDFYVRTASYKPRVSIYSKSEMRFPETDSYYYIGTAGQKAFGRGDTVHRAHLSEAAFYEDLERILAGVGEAAEYGTVDIETTANGRGQFHDIYQKAKNGKSSYTAFFIPWFISGTYTADSMTEEDKQGISQAVQEMFAVPDDEFLAGISDDEKRFMARVKQEYGLTLTAGQLKWRRYKIWDKGELFWQEYPEDDVSCFLQAGRSVFSAIITDITKRIPLDDLDSWRATPEEKDRLKSRMLYGGLDGAEGTLTGDKHSFAVIDVVDGKAVVIFEYTSNEPIDVFDLKVYNICKKFKIFIGIEKNGVGVAHVQKLKALGLRNFVEWETTGANRPVMISGLEEAYRKGELTETYPEAENEARDMEYNENNRAEHKKGKHDDRVFARAIAWGMRTRPRPGVSYV